jgi:hypothetical protein
MSSRKVKDSAAVTVRFINSPVTSSKAGGRSPQQGVRDEYQTTGKTDGRTGEPHDR